MSARSAAACWTLCMLVTLAASPPLVRAVCGGLSLRDVALGWAVAGVNGLTLFVLNRRAVGKNGQRFLRWGLLGNALRLGALFGTVAFYWWLVPTRFAPFGLTVAAGAIVFVLGEVAVLHVESLRGGAGGS